MTLNNQSKNQIFIKIPKTVTAFYCREKKIILFKNQNNSQKILKLKIDITFDYENNQIKTNRKIYLKSSRLCKKNNNAIYGTNVALIKQAIVETSTIFYKKLKFIGIGYRAMHLNNYNNKALFIKLGFSHPFYFYLFSKKTKIFCLKLTKLFIFGNSFNLVSQTAAYIRSYKSPEPYKGKGILYDNEKIFIKEGKRV
jgi:large subunit ribosomal protein L6